MLRLNSTDLCYCNSGRKYKNCHQRIEHVARKIEKERLSDLWSGLHYRTVLSDIIENAILRDLGSLLNIDLVLGWLKDRNMRLIDFDFSKAEEFRYIIINLNIELPDGSFSPPQLVDIPLELATKIVLLGYVD